MQDNKNEKKEYDLEDIFDENGPGLDKQGALYVARQVSEYASPCEYCNRGDCMECSFAYK